MADSSASDISSLVKVTGSSSVCVSSSSEDPSPCVAPFDSTSCKTSSFFSDKLPKGSRTSLKRTNALFLQSQIQKKDAQLIKMERKYETQIRSLHTELRELRVELAVTASEVARQNADRITLQQGYERQLDRLASVCAEQRQHAETYIEDLKSQWSQAAETISQQRLEAEVETLHRQYRLQLEALRAEHQLTIRQKDEEATDKIESLKKQLLRPSGLVSRIPGLLTRERRVV
jgi:hypothetical protein